MKIVDVGETCGGEYPGLTMFIVVVIAITVAGGRGEVVGAFGK